MGVYYKIVNPAKRQYLHPACFGEGIKWRSVLRGGLCIEALKYLIADDRNPPHASVAIHATPWELEGSWVGDPVILAGDDSTPPNPDGIRTSTPENPARNLNALADEEFYNISHLAIAMLCERAGYATLVVEKAEEDGEVFMVIAELLMLVQPPTLAFEFKERFGNNWRKRYEELFKQNLGHQPLPIH